jgi:poly(A) polymerase
MHESEAHQTPVRQGRGDARDLAVRDLDGVPMELVHQDALRVISRLERHGYEAYLVGGCVRDLLLGRKPKDFDVATSAHPRQIKRLFRNGRIIGRRFKLVHVVYGHHIVETATFRAKPEDSGDEDDLLITEDNVFGTAAEDADRRDFTINGLFLDPTRQRILDYVGGLDDLEHGLLRTIGDPEVRLHEDPVRILRAIKFATRLGFRITDDTWAAMNLAAPELVRSAPPRVLEEILRLVRSGTCLGAFRMLRACGALAVLMPEVDAYLGPRHHADEKTRDRADRYWRLLEALDAEVHAGESPSASLCLSALYLHAVEREADPTSRTLAGPPGDLAKVAAEVLEPIARTTRLSRRDVSRARRIITNQARFTQPRPRRFKPLLFLRSEEFPESLQLFKLRSAAWGQGWDVYEGWLERYRLALKVPQEELSQMRSKRKRSRRRSGRRRRGSGESGRQDGHEGSPEDDGHPS